MELIETLTAGAWCQRSFYFFIDRLSNHFFHLLRVLDIMMASSTPNKYPGITSPISLNPPTPQDIELTHSLIAYLKETGVFETEEESVQRELVLGKLNQLVKEFVREVGQAKNLPESLLAEAGGKIFTFGSYRLGVHGKGADIDTLCVTPQHVERSDFFGHFYKMLQAHPDVSDLTQVPDAYVPVINMKFAGISIDLVFARLSLSTIPDDLDLLNHSLLRNLEEKCILSLNGSRTTDEILRLVPNVETFHISLRCIKLWAKRRGLYSNAMGYLGGVACALLTARICQLYPHAAASSIIIRFFKIYTQWDWPRPVYLKQIEDLNLQQRVWNPRIHVSDRYHKMPVITPAYPSMCSTHNVSSSTLSLMMCEFQRGGEVLMRIEQGTANWSDLFEKSDFFYRNRFFFQLVASCESGENFRMWTKFVESRVRHLVAKLEIEANISSAPPYPEGFEKIVEATNLEEALRIHKHGETIPDSPHESKKTFYTMAFYIALVIAPLDPAHKGPRKLILDRPVMDFRAMINIWDKLTPDMNLLIRDIKRDALPDYLFEGQARPQLGPVRGLKKLVGTETPKDSKSSDVKHGRRISVTEAPHPTQSTAAHRSPEEIKRSRSSEGVPTESDKTPPALPPVDTGVVPGKV